MGEPESDIGQLLEQARQGDGAARDRLLACHRARLRAMVAVYFDRRLAGRLDPSDVVQQTLLEAARKLEDYLREQPLPFYPWLRQLAWDRLMKEHRAHLAAARRDVRRERPGGLWLSDESMTDLTRLLASSASSPSRHALRVEEQDRVRAALARLKDADREVLVLRYLEQLPLNEVAAVLRISTQAVKGRHFRALNRLRALLEPDGKEGRP